MAKGSGQTAELNADHRDIDPRFGTGDGAFVMAVLVHAVFAIFCRLAGLSMLGLCA